MDNTSSIHCYFAITDFEEVKEKVLNWSQQFSTFCFLDNHRYQQEHHSSECLLAAGVKKEYRGKAGLEGVEADPLTRTDAPWLFGHLGYGLLDENVSSLPERLGFDDLYFFEPAVLIRFEPEGIHIESVDPDATWEAIQKTVPQAEKPLVKAPIQQRFSREDYLQVIRRLREHILRGDCYEINFCQEFYLENCRINPLQVYQQLSRISPNPFSALYRTGDQWLICASPERYLRKEGGRILSQPIKGTSARDLGNAHSDLQQREALRLNAKDRSENVMVVDLVRNDLSRVCREGSVQVDELFGVYSFPQVHQMISTVSGQLREDISFMDIIRATFPMGSMTGAPKKKVMELISLYEKSRRGIFSGALGYISPERDFDFNVVIRSIMYNAAAGYCSFQAGSGITWYSDPEQEWEECRMKISAMEQVLR